MTTQPYTEVINGQFNWFVSTRNDSTRLYDSTVETKLGATTEDIEISITPEFKTVTSNHRGRIPVDRIDLGPSQCRVTMILQEHHKYLGKLNEMITQKSGVRGKLSTPGKLMMKQEQLYILKGVPLAGSAAADVYTAVWLYGCHVAGGEDWKLNFGINDQLLPLTLDLIPLIVNDDISSSHLIYYPDDASEPQDYADVSYYFFREETI